MIPKPPPRNFKEDEIYSRYDALDELKDILFILSDHCALSTKEIRAKVEMFLKDIEDSLLTPN